VDRPDTSGVRRTAAVTAAGALLLGAAGWMLLGQGDDAVVVPAAAVRRTVPATASATPTPGPTAAPSASATRRNPFVGLPSAAAPVIADAPPDAAAPVATTPSPMPVALPTATPTPTGTPVSATYALQLLSVTGSGATAWSVTFDVGGKRTTVLPAQRFGRYGELVVLAVLTDSKDSKDSKAKVTGVVLQVEDDAPTTVATGASVQVR
jgi:hypothetical protein